MPDTSDHDCRACAANPELRERWGCDKPTSHPQLTIRPCPVCYGIPAQKAGAECEVCGGKGQWDIYTCPRQLVEPDSSRMLACYSHYMKGILPDPGGMSQQTSYFVRALEIIEGAVNEEEMNQLKKMRDSNG